jgi:hypothetical protein
VQRGDNIDYTVTLLPNTTPGDRTHTITTTVPSYMTLDEASVTGEPVISGNQITWEVAQESLFGAEPTYNVSNNFDDASCAMPNFGQPGSAYIDLANFGVPTSDFDGDTIEVVYNIPGNFLGTPFGSFTITDDGIITFGEVGDTSWLNQFTPNADAPNNLVAPFWRDMLVTASETTGVSVATNGPNQTFIEFDDMYHYRSTFDPAATDVLDFQVYFENNTGNFAFAYDNVSHGYGDALGVTVGWENATGTSGSADIYSPTYYDGAEAGQVDTVQTIQSGLVMCYTLADVDISPTVFNFTASINDDYVGGPLSVAVNSTTDDLNTEEQAADSSGADIQVEAPPSAVIIADASVDELSDMTLDGSTSMDPNGDVLTYSWTQLSGPPIAITDNAAPMISFTAPRVMQDQTASFELTVDDGNGNTDTSTATFIIVRVQEPPTAVITGGSSVEERGTIQLDGSASNDANGDELTYTWTQLGGPVVSFNANSATISITAPEVSNDQTVSMQLTVDDGFGNSDSAVRLITIRNNKVDSGSFGWLLLLITPVLLLRRRKL